MDIQIAKWREEREYDRIIGIINARIQHAYIKHSNNSAKVYAEILETLAVGILAAHIERDEKAVKLLTTQLAHVYHRSIKSYTATSSFEVIYE